MKISPSAISADLAHFAESIARIEQAGADMLHLDVMDGNFVPNMSFGPMVIAALRKHSGLFFDVHLMIDRPERYIDDFIKAGADGITIHYESTADPAAVLADIRAKGKRTGLSVKPGTPASVIEPLLPLIDMVLIMTVEPGFGGQKLMPDMLVKAREVRDMLDSKGYASTDLQADGGIALANLKEVLASGVNVVVAGTAILGAEDPAAAIAAFRAVEQ